MSTTIPAVAAPKPQSRLDDFAELVQRVRSAGLLERRPSWYVVRSAVTLLALAASITWLVLVDSFWLQIPNALFLAFILGQIGLLGHDAGHRQVSNRTWFNALLGFSNNLIVGGSWTWWVHSHDRHHGRPNQLGHDPATNFEFIAMTEEQAAAKRGFSRFMVRHQAVFIVPLMALYCVSLRMDSIRHLVKGPARHPRFEATLLALHAVGWIALLVACLGTWQALLFILINQAVFGLYVASIFLPNHHGMPVIDEEGEGLDFLRLQVVTARNIKGGRFTDFWFGGLNHQIEHHLFPQAPRANLRAIRGMVRDYCVSKGIAYHEAGWRQSFREVFIYLHQMAAPLRRSKESCASG